MKASRVIAKLQNLIQTEGDQELRIEGGYDDFMSIVDIEVFDDEENDLKTLILVAEVGSRS